ncbi:MAG: hypothetical protein QGI49_11240, partial [SAR202 cluster bacterium]|nr:hypothetical protein [SAR202 cluster bacterium]
NNLLRRTHHNRGFDPSFALSMWKGLLPDAISLKQMPRMRDTLQDSANVIGIGCHNVEWIPRPCTNGSP